MAFCTVGAGQQLLDRLGGQLVVTREVMNELIRHRQRLPNLNVVIDWLGAEEEAKVYTLSSESATEVLDVVRLLGGGHPDEHVGEVATVFAAVDLIEAGEEVVVLMDDQDGRRLGRAKGLVMIDCPALLVDMVCGDDLDFALAGRIWREKLFPGRREVWPALAERVSRDCPDKAPPARR
jgi:hypothetical protein